MDEPTFTPAADVIEAYTDGSGHGIVARAGEPMSWTRAQMLGLVEGEAPAFQIVSEPDGPPLAIVSEEIRDPQGAVVARSKRPQKAKGQ